MQTHRRCLPFVLVLGGLAVGEAKTFPEFPVRSVSEYALRQTASDVTVAVEPLPDRDSQRKYFDFEFAGRGYLPVFVVIENASSHGYILKKEEIVTERGAGSSVSAVPATSRAGMTVGVAAAAAVSVVGIFVASRMLAGATEVRQNVTVKEIRTQTLSTGRRGSGFVYVPLDKNDGGELVLRVPLANIQTGDTLAFRFALPVPLKK